MSISQIHMENAAEKCASVHISVCVPVCRCLTGQHMASPACSEILIKSSVSKITYVCMCVCVIGQRRVLECVRASHREQKSAGHGQLGMTSSHCDTQKRAVSPLSVPTCPVSFIYW